MTDMLDDVRFLREELDRITQDVDRQIEELGEFIMGHRQSIYPLGSKLLISVGHQLDELRLEIEQRMAVRAR